MPTFLSFFVMLAVIDTQCLHLLVYLGLQNRVVLILLFLFHLLVRIIYEEKLSCIYYLITQW